MTSIFRLDAETTSSGVTRTRSLPQGDPSAPMIFNIILDTLAEKFIRTAREKGWGLCLADGSWVDLILFADNYWLVATSPQMLRAMTVEWLRLLGEVGWETPTSELTWCTTMHDDVNMKIVVNEEIAKRAGNKEGFKVLGTIVTFDNNYDVELEHRIQKAVISFHKNKDLLLCSSVPLGKRLQVFRATVEASLLWCAGSWNLTLEQYQRLRGAQLRLVRRMLRLKRNKDETMPELIIRSNHILKHRLRDLGTVYESWD